MIKINTPQDLIKELTNSQLKNLSFLDDLNFNNNTMIQITVDAIFELITTYIYPAKSFLIKSVEDKLYYDISESVDIEIHGLQMGLLMQNGVILEYCKDLWEEKLENAGIEVHDSSVQESMYVIWRAIQISNIIYELINYIRQLKYNKLNISIVDKIDRLSVSSWLYDEILYWKD